MKKALATAHRSLYVLHMRSKRPSKLSEIQQARLTETARVFCSTLNELSASVSATSADYLVISDLNAAVLAAVKEITGQSAPWILPASAASYPKAGGSG